METFNRTRTEIYNDEIKIVKLKKTIMIYSSTIGNENSKTSFFALKNDYRKALRKSKGNIFKAIGKIKNRYQCYSEEILNAINYYGFNKKLPNESDTLKMIWEDKHIIDPILAIKLSDFDENKLGYFYSDANLMYTVKSGKNPLSIPYYINYINGVTNENFNLKQALGILKASSYVFDIKEIQIPYYNATSYCNKAIEFRVKLSQNTYNKLCEYYRDIKAGKYWTCCVEDAMVWREYYEDADIDLDFIGLKSCYIKTDY